MSTIFAEEPLAPPAPLVLPSLSRDEPLYEVVDGQRLELPPMSIYAALIASLLQEWLGPFVRAHGLGWVVTEGLFILDATRNLRRRPDVAFVGTDRWPLSRDLPETGDWEVVPHLAVEVVSPTDVFENVLGKMREYFSVGVRLVWVVVPSMREVYVFEAPARVRIVSAAEELDGGEVLPGFRLPVAVLFNRQGPVAGATPLPTGP